MSAAALQNVSLLQTQYVQSMCAPKHKAYRTQF